jgi:hypothetical protein
MSKKSSRSPNRKPQRYQSKILETMTPADALTILRRLAEQDVQMAKRFEDAAMEILRGVDVDGVASEVQMELESLIVEDVWDASGSTSRGYVDPGDAAWQMFEDALEPFQEQVEKYKRLSMNQEAKFFCMGILKGIYDFHKESSTEYKDWAIDAPGEFFSIILDDWRESTKKRKDLVEMDEFMESNCADWAPSSRKKRG